MSLTSEPHEIDAKFQLVRLACHCHAEHVHAMRWDHYIHMSGLASAPENAVGYLGEVLQDAGRRGFLSGQL
jgi:hypothetical protein